MKTLHEMEQERIQQEGDWQARFQNRRLDLLRQAEQSSIKPYITQKEYDKNDYEKIRKELREQLREGKADPLDVACDHCGTELVDRSPGTITCSMPPMRYIGCVGCGWLGYSNL